jgi:hypothetical protein
MSTRTATDLLANLTTHELFAVHGALQEELKRRDITQTTNIIEGVGEHLGLGMYGGHLSRNASVGMILTDPNGTRIQVRTRTAGGPDFRRSLPVDPSGYFDFHVFLLIEPDTFRPVMARRVSRERVKELLTSEKRLSVATVRHEGDDVLAEAVVAWQYAG